MKLSKSILSIFLAAVVLLGSTTIGFSKHTCNFSGETEFVFLNSNSCCKALGVYIGTLDHEVRFEAPLCCEIELIKHIGTENVLKRKTQNWADFTPAKSMGEIQLFPLLRPITHNYPEFREISPYRHTRQALLQVYMN